MKYSSNRKLVFIASVFLVCAIPVVSVFASPTISSVYQGTSKSYVLFKDGTVYSFDMNSESVKKVMFYLRLIRLQLVKKRRQF